MFEHLPLPLVIGLLAAVPGASGASEAGNLQPVRHRYLVVRTFPAGALDGLDAAAKATFNVNNAELGVAWIRSYATADKTRTFCVYEADSPETIRAHASAADLPVDEIVQIVDTVIVRPDPVPVGG